MYTHQLKTAEKKDNVLYFRLFERGIQHFKVILGDSNLNIDLPFGVQSHDISDVIIHENYKPEDSLHFDDIGEMRFL
jgi:hypothetical protein